MVTMIASLVNYKIISANELSVLLVLIKKYINGGLKMRQIVLEDGPGNIPINTKVCVD